MAKRLKFTKYKRNYNNYKNYRSRYGRKTKDYKNYKDNKNFRNYELEKECDLGNEKIDINHLENMFSNKILYVSMKYLPILYKEVLYLCVYENRNVDYISKCLNISRFKVIRIREKAIKMFRKNIKNYQKDLNIRKVDIKNG